MNKSIFAPHVAPKVAIIPGATKAQPVLKIHSKAFGHALRGKQMPLI